MQNSDNKDKDLTVLFDDLKADILDYAAKKINYIKLGVYEKISIAFSLLAFGAVIAILIAGLLFFALFGLAFFLGELLNSLAAGFGILFVFVMFVLIILLIFNRKIRRFIMNKTILIIRKMEDNEDF